jgi:large subunit ribosomal protein L10
MNKDRKTAVIDEVAAQIDQSDAIFVVDYRGLSVPQAADLRQRLAEADATLRVVKNTLTERAADKAGADDLKDYLDGPTAFAFVRGDAAPAAKAIATFRRAHAIPEFKGGRMDGETLSLDEIQTLARLPARDVLQGQFVATLAAPITGLVRGLGALVQGLAVQLKQLEERALASGDDAGDALPLEEAPEDVTSRDEPANGDDSEAPSEGDAEPNRSQPAEPAASQEKTNRGQPAEPAASQQEG